VTRPATETEVLAAERDALLRQVTHFRRSWGRAAARAEKGVRQLRAAQEEVDRLTAIVKDLCKRLHDLVDDDPCEDCRGQGFFLLDRGVHPCICTDTEDT
jgi:hypothetical protein